MIAAPLWLGLRRGDAWARSSTFTEAFFLGAPETAPSLTANLVVRSGVQALSLDYRFAPENPFPAAVNYCADACRALIDRGESPAQIVFAGDSAGGGLAVTTVLKARELGLPTHVAPE